MSATDPFLLPPRSVISFSGGRTSGLMLRKILDAFGGKLPEDRKVIFENTGKEREETLVFIEECSQRWGVEIIWLEYRWEPGRPHFAVVDFATASRNGEPFEAAIRARTYLPNPIARFCTAELKIRTCGRYVRQHLGWDTYTNAVGLRADEPKRVRKMIGNKPRVEGLFGPVGGKRKASPITPGDVPVCPLAEAGITLSDVDAFWSAQPFGLQLRQDEGNCDLCFLKGAAKLIRLIKERPERADWWIAMESVMPRGDSGATFRSDRPTYRELKLIATDQQDGPGWLWSDNGNNGSCGEIDECRCTD